MDGENKLKHTKKIKTIKKGNKNNKENKIKIDNDSDLYNLTLDKIKNTKIYNFYEKYYDIMFNKAIQMENSHKKINTSSQNNTNKKIIINIKKKYILTENKNKKNNKYGKNNLSFTNDNTQIINDSFINNNNNLNNSSLDSDLSKSVVLSNIHNLKEFRLDTINFEIKYDTKMGESLSIIGSLNELGSWKQKKALKMKWNEGNIWKVSLKFNNNIKDFEYKFIVIECNNVKYWEDGNNRKFIISKMRELFEPYIDNYNNSKNIISFDNIMNQSLIYNISNYSMSIVCNWNKY